MSQLDTKAEEQFYSSIDQINNLEQWSQQNLTLTQDSLNQVKNELS